MTFASRELPIDFLFLDLDTCTRCRATEATLLEAVELTRPALEAVGVSVTVTKTRVASEAQARALGFVSSPTIRVGGVDIAGELVESRCDTCTESCACDGGVDCRDWIYRGERRTEPPVGLIVEAILRHAVPHNTTSAGPDQPAQTAVPENLHRYFAGTAAAPDTPQAPCCSTEVQAGCCPPEEEAACGGTAMPATPCGCNA